MAEAILFPDAVSLVIEYLLDQFADIGETAPVVVRVPNPRPARFVNVLRTGGVRQTLVTDGAQVTVDSWADNDQDAHDLAQRARAFVNALPGVVQDGVAMYGVVEFAGPGSLPDPLSAQARYTQTFQVGTRGHAMSPAGS